MDAIGSTCNKGLIFNGSNQNSALILSGKDFTRLNNGFRIEFHFFIYSASKYGSIFRILDNKQSLVDFSYYPMPKNGGRLTLRLESTGQQLSFDLDQQNISRNAWQHIEISYIEATHSILLKFNNKSKVIQKVTNFIHKDGSFHIGPISDVSNSANSSAHFAIKNVSVFSNDGRLQHFYPLEKNRKDKVIDLTGNQHLNIINPRWIEDLHSHWSENFKSASNTTTAGTFSVVHQESYIFTGEVLSVVSADNYNHKIIPVIRRFNSDAFHLLFNKKQDELFCFNSTWNELIVFDLTDFSQTYFSLKNTIPAGHQSIGFYHLLRKTPMVLIGSKDHAFTGHFYSLDLKQQIWKKVPIKQALSIDSLYTYHLSPNLRKLQLLCSNPSKSTTELQLMEVNLTSFTLKTLAKFNSPQLIGKGHRISQNFISPSNNQEFYLFQQVKDSAFIIKLDTSTSRIDRIPVSFPGKNIQAPFLCFNPHTDELLCIAHEETSQQTGIFTINFPPTSIILPSGIINISRIEQAMLALLAFLTGCIIFLFIVAHKRKKKLRELMNHTPDHFSKSYEENKTDRPFENEPSKEPTYPLNRPSSIELFGSYHIFNPKGKQVNDSFTSFLEEFFLFLLVSGIFLDGKGITSEEINQAFWPYHDARSARNNRGVNISRLRKILIEIDGIDLIFDKNQYQLVLSDAIEIDLQVFLKITHTILRKRTLSKSELTTVSLLIGKGSFLNHLTTSWLDPYREQFELLLSQLLEVIISSSIIKEQFEDVLDFCRLVLIHDKLNESALQIVLFIHGNQQKKDLQRQVYQSFSRNYMEVMGEAYSLTIKECISSMEKQMDTLIQ